MGPQRSSLCFWNLGTCLKWENKLIPTSIPTHRNTNKIIYTTSYTHLNKQRHNHTGLHTEANTHIYKYTNSHTYMYMVINTSVPPIL